MESSHATISNHLKDAVERKERALLNAIANQQVNALEKLFRLYQKRLVMFFRRLGSGPELAEELVNDVMYTVWKKAGQFEGRSKVSTWIFTISYHAFAGAKRRQKPTTDLHPADEAQSDPQLQRLETQDLLQKALAKLPEQQSHALQLYYFEGLTCPEIGQVVGCPENTVKTRMFHGKRKLKETLKLLSITANDIGHVANDYF